MKGGMQGVGAETARPEHRTKVASDQQGVAEHSVFVEAVGETGVPLARLRRALTLPDLLLYGAIIISPMSPMSVFGVLSERGGGHVATAILIGLVAMLFTGISYGRMARAYPSAGSAFTYVAREIHPALGYVTGWGMLMDYILGPMVCTIWCAEQAHEFVTSIPRFAWQMFFAAALTFLNIQGIRSSARINAVMAAGMGVVIVLIFAAASRYIFGHPHADPGFFSRPFYDPKTFSYGGLFGCTSIAVVTYIGFDGISTLSEEAVNPRRNIMLATVLSCTAIGILSAAEVYVAQLVWPAAERFPNVDTAYVWAVGRMWEPLFSIVGFTLLVGTFGAGMATHLGAARLLYGMGRSNALPRRFFGAIDPKHRIPRNNVVLVGVIVVVGAYFLTYQLAIEMVNFGALIAFMGVNAAAFIRYFVRETHKRAWNFIPPVLGFFICLVLWWNLSESAKIFGSIWMLVGVAFGTWKTRGFRTSLSFEVPEDTPATFSETTSLPR
jgi:putrescine importer